MSKDAKSLYHPGPFALCLPCAQQLPISGCCPEPAKGSCFCCGRAHPQVVTLQVTEPWRPCEGEHHDAPTGYPVNGCIGRAAAAVWEKFRALPVRYQVTLGVAGAVLFCLFGVQKE